MVFNDQTGPSDHKYLAETEKSQPLTPGLEYEAAGARDPKSKWYTKRGLYIGENEKWKLFLLA